MHQIDALRHGQELAHLSTAQYANFHRDTSDADAWRY
jgi:hypothetical protein